VTVGTRGLIVNLTTGLARGIGILLRAVDFREAWPQGAHKRLTPRWFSLGTTGTFVVGMEFRLLGPLEVLVEGEPVVLGGQKQRGILALLLLQPNQVVSTDRLIDELWGERPPRTVDAYIQNCVWRLRHALGRDLIETRPPGYLLRVDSEQVDALRFERSLEVAPSLGPPERVSALREALSLWRGQPLADLSFEGFAGIETTRLDELRLIALELRIDAELELGRHDSVLPEIEALASRHPSRERLRYLQMLALYRAGRQLDALRVYQEARLDLIEQFGLEPGEELRALERMVISHDPSLTIVPGAAGEHTVPPQPRNVVGLLIELAGSGLAEQVARDRTAATLTEIALIVDRHGGVLQHASPDDAVAVFGAPRSHDDDAMRALRAAVEIRSALPRGIVARIVVERAAAEHIGAAKGLLQGAVAGEVLLGPAALRLVPHAVDVVPHESGSCYRVLRFDSAAEPFLRHLDAPLVGRQPELAHLDDEAALAIRGRAPRHVVVLGDVGIGKTRLALEFVARAAATFLVLRGRCIAYGDGTDLLPVRELLAQVGPLETALAGEPDADRVIAHLREPSLTEKTEGFWALRRLIEAAARDRPILLVLDDVQWAGQTFLDLVEYLVGWAAAPILVVSLARPELLDARPEWRAEALVLAPLGVADAHELAAALPGNAGRDPSSLTAAVAAAEGNPLFLEQLLEASADELNRLIPPTVEVLIESRLDQLPPAERRALERAAVVGRVFWRAAVEALTPGAERVEVSPALMALVRRRLIRAERSPVPGEDGFRFHHALIRDVVYAGIAEIERAALHESVARLLDGLGAELDELVGYHLEQAALLHDRGGDPAPALAEAAGRRLGAAGLRAVNRIDGRAGVDLLTRATALLADDASRLELDWALATSVKVVGDASRADTLLEDVARKAERFGDTRIEMRARLEQIWMRLALGQLSAEDALALLDRAKPIFGAAGDELGLGRAWDLTAAVEGVYRLRYGEAERTALRAGRHYARSGFGDGVTLVRLAAAAHRGPTPAHDAIRRCESLLSEAPSPVWGSFILPFLAGVEAMDGQFASARSHLEEARVGRQEFADSGTIATSWSAIAAEVELLAGDLAAAEDILLRACQALRAAGPGEWLATNTALLAETQYRQGRVEEAKASGESALARAPAGHLTACSVARRVVAKSLAQLGAHAEAVALAEEALALLDRTDVLDERGETLVACAEALAASGESVAARHAWEKAISEFERKGNVVSAERARARLGRLS
jgi:DNA-binding SARP family transcriptional activator